MSTRCESNPACTPSEYACTEQRTEETRNGILEATAHHPYAGEDETAETDDSARVDGERLERPHERLSPGEVHRSLGVSNARKRERKEGRSQHAKRVGECLLAGQYSPMGELGFGLKCVLTIEDSAYTGHRHLRRLSCSRDMPESRRGFTLKSNA